MSMFAKVLVTVAQPDEHVDVFDLVARIEKAVNGLVRGAADNLRKEDESRYTTFKREGLATAQTMIRPPLAGCRTLYTQFSIGVNQRRNLQVIIDPADQNALPEKGTVLLSVGMGGAYKEILSACAKAISSNGTFLYGDDSFNGFIAGEELETSIEASFRQLA